MENRNSNPSINNMNNSPSKKVVKIQGSTEKLGKMSTSKYTPVSRNTDVDLSVVENWYEVRTKNIPKRRAYHCSWNIKDSIYVFGGKNLNLGKNAEFYKINLAAKAPTWTQFIPQGEKIEPLAYCAYTTFEDCFYIIGGQNQSLTQVNSVFKITPDMSEESKVLKEEVKDDENDSQISPLDNVVMTNDLIEKIEFENAVGLEGHCASPAKEGIYVFGGFSNSKFQNKLYYYDMKNKKVIEKHSGETSCPCERISSTSIFYLEKFYIFGGQDKEGKFLNDLWVYDTTKDSWEEILNQENESWPCGRSGHSMNLYNNEIYIFGGRTNNVMEVNELWKFIPESKSFELIQESLLEQYENESTYFGEEHKKKRANASFLMQKSKIISDANLGKNKLKKINTNNHEFETAMYSSFPTLSLMTNSLIFGMETETQTWKRTIATLNSKSSQNDYISIMGNIPTPRDGHSSIIYKDYMVIFGGDRNKFPLNDLYTFVF